MKLKELVKLFYVNVDLYHKGQYVGQYNELEDEHWIFECEVRGIDYIDNEIAVDTK